MTELRQRMIADLRLRGYSERTVQAYVHPVAQLAQHYRTPPDRLTEEHIRDYLLHLTHVQKVSRSTHTIALCGIKFFYQHTLGRQWKVLEIARPRAEKKLPAVLSRDEVAQILAAVRTSRFTAPASPPSTAVDCACSKEPSSRCPTAMAVANSYTSTTAKAHWTATYPFPTRRSRCCASSGAATATRSGSSRPERAATSHRSMTRAVGAISRSSLPSAFVRAVKKCGIRKQAHVHTLRHSYATHLLEDGVPVQLIQEYLGLTQECAHHHALHASVDTWLHFIPTGVRGPVSKRRHFS